MPVFIPLQKLQVSHHGKNEGGRGAGVPSGRLGNLLRETCWIQEKDKQDAKQPLGARFSAVGSPAGRGAARWEGRISLEGRLYSSQKWEKDFCKGLAPAPAVGYRLSSRDDPG